MVPFFTDYLERHDMLHNEMAWCLRHALEHTAMHVGHMQLTRQLIPTMLEGRSA